jgi:hypothetical protein
VTRQPADYRAVHAEADRFEPRLARALRRSIEKLRERVSINALAMALHARDARTAVALLKQAIVADVLSPAGTIIRDAVLRGGKVGAERLNEAR